MCAIDALGLPAMAGRDGRITSADPADGTPIEVTVRDGIWAHRRDGRRGPRGPLRNGTAARSR